MHANPENPWLAWGRYLAHGLAEARGWSRRVRLDVDRALVVLLSPHTEGDVIRYSEIIAPLRALDSSIERTAEVLEAMSILVDDRRPSYEDWLEKRLDGLAAGIRREAERWNRTLRDGGPRTRPRDQATVWAYLNAVRPALLEWSAGHDHLREVTRDDVLAHVKTLHGHEQRPTLVALRSLFGWAKKNGIVFRNPTARIKVGTFEYSVLQPLLPQQVTRSVEAVRSPAARLALALAPPTPPGPEPSALSSWTTWTWATAGSPSPDAPAPWTTSPTRCCWPGWTTGAGAGRTPPTPTCSSTR
ncbi:hypothetical protein NRF20_07550 [Streptomyces sp. R-74717]|uniref:hypothetical protein n=1 Tax=Streptomyces TaxID=1883 RepID=UPI0037A262AE